MHQQNDKSVSTIKLEDVTAYHGWDVNSETEDPYAVCNGRLTSRQLRAVADHLDVFASKERGSPLHPIPINEMTVGELQAELGMVWCGDWENPNTMTLDELRAEVSRVWALGMQPGSKKSPETTIPPHVAAYFPPVDWTKSELGKAVWDSWNALESAIVYLMCAQPHQITECAANVELKRDLMALALRDRDKPTK